MDPQSVLEAMVASVGKPSAKVAVNLSPVSVERTVLPLNDPAPVAFPNDWPTQTVLNTLGIIQHGINALQQTVDDLRAAVSPAVEVERDVEAELVAFNKAAEPQRAALAAAAAAAVPVGDAQVKFLSDLAEKTARAQAEVFGTEFKDAPPGGTLVIPAGWPGELTVAYEGRAATPDEIAQAEAGDPPEGFVLGSPGTMRFLEGWVCPDHGTYKLINVKGEKVRRCTMCPNRQPTE